MSKEDEIICHCLQVTESVVRQCIEAGKLASVEQVTSACKAGGGCHSCHVLIQLFIDQSQGETPFQETVQHNGNGHKKRLFDRLLSRFRTKSPVT